MIQVLPEKSIIDDFVSKMHKHWPSWNTATPTTRLNDLNIAIKEICNRQQRPCHELVAPKATTGIVRTRFNDRQWQIEVDSAINNSRMTDNQFAEILASAFKGLSDAELYWYNIIGTIVISNNLTPSILKIVYNCPLTVLQEAFNYVNRAGAHNIVSSIQYIHQPKSIAELVSDSCRKRGMKVTIHTGAPPLSPGLGPAGFNWNRAFNAAFGGVNGVNISPVAPVVGLSSDLSKPCFSKKDFKEKKLKKTLNEWAKVRNQDMPMGTKINTWKHVVHMDYRVLLTNNPPDLLVNGRFPNDWKKISASLVSDQMPNWTYLYRRYPDGSNHGGGLRVGYILDIPPQNILSTSPEDVASINSEKHIKRCRLHPGGACEIACYIKHNTPEQLGKHHPKAIYALDSLLDPDTFLRETRNCPNRKHQQFHQNEMLIMCREGTNRTHVYEGAAPIGDIKAKAIYLIVDDDDLKYYYLEAGRDRSWAEQMAVKHNLPIFEVNRQTGVGTYRSPDKKAVDKGLRPHFNYLKEDTNRLIKGKLAKWDLVRKTKIDQKKPHTWQHIVHMDFRATNGGKPLLTARKFPSNWKKISASLVTNETPDWTYGANGATGRMRVGYILDVPAQNILSTNSGNIFSRASEHHISQCKRKHKSGGCHVLCYVEANARNRGKDLNAFESLLSPEELVREQKMYNAKNHNELVIMGPGTPNRVLYKGVPRTGEVKVKGIYLVVSKTDPQKDRERDLKWAEKEAKRNANKKEGSLPIFTVHI